MPLLDHFHLPLRDERHWESFHGAWAPEIMRSLNNGALPKGYFAEIQVHIGGVEVDVDVAMLQEGETLKPATEGNGGVGVLVEAQPTTFTMPSIFPDSIEVHIFETAAGPTLVGAIELISPGNKDRPETRPAFAAKCAAYLHEAVGLLIVDIVTDQQANLHDELIELLRQKDAFRFPGSARTYCVAYHPSKSEKAEAQIAVCCAPLAVGSLLPRMPLALRGGPTVIIDLETTYTETRAGSQL